MTFKVLFSSFYIFIHTLVIVFAKKLDGMAYPVCLSGVIVSCVINYTSLCFRCRQSTERARQLVTLVDLDIFEVNLFVPFSDAESFQECQSPSLFFSRQSPR
jgi:hypothetical protein